MTAASRRELVALLDEMFHGPAWHGASLRAALGGLAPRQAAKPPAPGRHNIAELTVHCAYWKYMARRRITPLLPGGGAIELPAFSLAGRNFFPRDRVTAASWKADLALLDAEHAALVSAVRRLPPRR